jgi:hypothetical protein
MINDNAFLASTSSSVDKSNDLDKVANLLGSNSESDSPLPVDTLVEFVLPDNTILKGKVASKCGDDYLINVNDGESYIIPMGKLAKVDKKRISEIVSEVLMPHINLRSYSHVGNRIIAFVDYKGKYPSDNQLIKWGSKHFPDLELVDAKSKQDRNIDLIFEITAAEDVHPQGGDQNVRGMGLTRESIPGTGVISEASPLTGIEEVDVEKGLKVELEHTEDEEIARQIAIDHLAEDPDYYEKLEKVEKKSFSLEDTIPKSISLDSIIKQAIDTCASLADSVLSEHGGYTAAAHNDFTARLTKLAVDPHAKEYWSKYFGEYGKQWTRDIPKKKHKKKSQASFGSSFEIGLDDGEEYNEWEILYYYEPEDQSVGFGETFSFESAESDTGEVIIDEEEFKKRFNLDHTWLADNAIKDLSRGADKKADTSNQTKEYWTKYFGEYGGLLTRNIPRKIAQSDYIGYIEETNNKYEVKSKKNPNWSGGTYNTKEEAEKRLGQVEMFKHMKTSCALMKPIIRIARDRTKKKIQKQITRDAIETARDAVMQATGYDPRTKEHAPNIDEQLQNLITTIGRQYLNEHPRAIYTGGRNYEDVIGEAFQLALVENTRKGRKRLDQVKNLLKTWDERQIKGEEGPGVFQKVKEWFSPSEPELKKERLQHVPVQELIEEYVESGESEEEVSAKTPQFDKLSQQQKYTETDLDIIDALEAKSQEELTEEEIDYLIRFYTWEETGKELPPKESPLLQPSTVEEAMKEPTYQPPPTRSSAEDIAKRQEIVEEELGKIRESFKNQIPVTEGMSILDWVIPSYQDTPDGGEWAGYKLSDALWDTWDNKEDRQNLYHILVNNFPRYYTALVYSMLPKDKALEEHERIEKSIGDAISIPPEVGLPDTPRPLKRVTTGTYFSQQPEYKEWVEDHLRSTKKKKWEEEKEIKESHPVDIELGWPEVDEELGEELGLMKEKKRQELVKGEPEVEKKDTTKERQEYLEKYHPKFVESEVPEEETKIKERKEPEVERLETYPKQTDPELAKQQKEWREESVKQLEEAEDVEQQQTIDKEKRLEQEIRKIQEESKGRGRKKQKHKFTPKTVRGLKIVAQEEEEQKIPERMNFLHLNPEELAKRMMDSNSVESRQYDMWLDYILKPTKAVTEYSYANRKRVSPWYAGMSIREIMADDQGPDYLAYLASISRSRGMSRLLAFTLADYKYELTDVKKERAKRYRKLIKETEGIHGLTPPEIERERRTKGPRYRDVEIKKKPREEEAAEISEEEKTPMDWEIPEGFGPHSNKPLWQAFKDAGEGTDDRLDLENMLRLQHSAEWLDYIQYRYGDTGVRKEQPLIEDLKLLQKEFDIGDIADREKLYDLRSTGYEIAQKVYSRAMPLKEAYDIAKEYEEKGEPGLYKYLSYHFEKSDPELYKEWNEYARVERRKPEVEEWERKKKEKAKSATDFLITKGHPDLDFWFNKTIGESFKIAKQSGIEELDRFKKFMGREYPEEWFRFLTQLKIQEQKKREEFEKGRVKVSPEKEEDTKIEKEQEKVLEETRGIPVEEIPGGKKTRETKKEMEELRALPGMREEEESETRERQEKLKTLQRLQKSLKQRGASMQKKSDAGPGPYAYNAPGKDDKKDYDHKDRNKQPARNMNKFCITRMYSTTSSDDNGYIMMEIGWEPDLFEGMSPQNIQHQIISYIKGLESDKYYHDFGITGKPKFIEFDQDAGVARIKVRCSESRGVMTLTYSGDEEKDALPLVGIR